MTNRILQRQKVGLFAAAVCALLLSILITVPAQAAGGAPAETEKYCLTCHGDPNLSTKLPSGETLSLYVSQDVIGHSIHSPLGIECAACHTEITTYPHPKIEYKTHRELSRNLYLACQKCHPGNYEKSLDSMHAKAATAGNENAAICTDCHGSHDVKKPDEPRSLISTTCAKCHQKIVDQYKSSIHGSALINDNNQDVPVCTDCHGVHNIQDPRTADFRVKSPEMCAHCHANKELMDKYNLPSDVYSLYKTSWHGVDVSVYKSKWPTIWHDSAVCTDCHGIHNIYKTDDPASSVNPKNLLTTCQKCHPTAGPNWTGAWTGHNKISLQRTPILFYVEAFYSSFTPFVLWICIIYVVLQIIRSIVDRVRRSLP
ncbi:MAG: cytochrome c3 family protein [Chloroflexota bacterium]